MSFDPNDICELSEVGVIQTGTTPSKKDKRNYGTSYPFYKPTDLNEGIGIRNSRDKLSNEGWKLSRVASRNSVLVTCIGATIGKTGLIVEEGAFNQQINAINPSQDSDPKFLYYQIVGPDFQKQIKDNASSTTLPILNKSRFSKLRIWRPPLPEQHRIVAKIEELFSELDKGVESLKTAQAQLKTYRQAVLKAAFEGKLTSAWRKGQGDFSKVEQFYQEIQAQRRTVSNGKLKDFGEISREEYIIPDLAMGWKWVKLGNVSNGVEYGSSKKSEKEGNVPVLRMGNIQRARFEWGDLVYTSDPKEISKYVLKGGDVLFNRTNSPELVGKTAIYKGEMEAIFAGYLIRVNQVDAINPDYLNYFLNSKLAQTYGNSVKTDGVNQSNINGQKLSNYPFPLCTKAEQKEVVQEIESRLSVCDHMEKSIQEGLQQSESLRQSILKRAFEGRLV